MYLWSFLTYGFLGYLLEKVYALVTRSRHTVRKGYLLLPVCPVYGLAMLAVLALPPDMTDTFWHLALYGGLTATAVEYAVHFCCDRLLGVMFWDYSSTKMDLNRRVCLPFALIWGPLAAMTARYIHPLLRPWLTAVPPGYRPSYLRSALRPSRSFRIYYAPDQHGQPCASSPG